MVLVSCEETGITYDEKHAKKVMEQKEKLKKVKKIIQRKKAEWELKRGPRILRGLNLDEYTKVNIKSLSITSITTFENNEYLKF